ELSQGQAARLLPTTFRTQPADPRAGSRSTSSLPNYGGVHSLIPVKDTNCGLPGALSATDNVPIRDPICVGLNVTPIVQLARGATLVPAPMAPVATTGSCTNSARPLPRSISGAVWTSAPSSCGWDTRT